MFTPIRSNGENGGKAPLRKRWQSEPPLPLEELQRHRGNIALRTGRVSGVVVVDVDTSEALEDLAERLPSTVEVITGGGGRHFYYAYDGPLGNPVGRLHDGVDIRADGGCVVYPGSVHPETGVEYAWAEGSSPDDVDLAPLPEWIVDALAPPPKPEEPARMTALWPKSGNGTAKYCETALAGECAAVRNAEEGTRNDRLNAASFSIGGLFHTRELSRNYAEVELLQAALDCGLSEIEARATIRSGLTAGEASPREVPEDRKHLGHRNGPIRRRQTNPKFIEYSEPMRLAEHLIDFQFLVRGELYLRRHRQEWWRFNGRYYEILPDEQVAAITYTHIDQVWTFKRDRTGNVREDDAGLPIHAKVKLNKNTVNETLAAATARDTLVTADPPCWLPDGNVAANLIPCRNGVLNVQTGQLLPLTARLFCTWGLPFDYDADAANPQEWLRFLSQLWLGDPQSIETLQELFGLALTANTKHQKIFLLVGPKRSGKGTIARVLTGMLGAANVAAPTLAGLTTTFGLQPLIGKPLAIISDARLSGRTDQTIVVERLLSISGEDAVTIDRKHRDPVTVTLPTRFLVLTNELPRLNDSSGAIASRFIILKLCESFYEREDHGLLERLLNELAGILNWALEGLRRLDERGYFVQPESAREELEELEILGSPVITFVHECCTVGPGETAEIKALFKKWQEWCNVNGREHSGTSQTFGRDLRAAFPFIRITRPRKNGDRIREYQGISYGN